MSTFQEKFSGSWMLSGERKKVHNRNSKTDSAAVSLSIWVAIVAYATDYAVLNIISLAVITALLIYRAIKKETLLQLKLRELQAGKRELKKMRQDMDEMVGAHE